MNDVPQDIEVTTASVPLVLVTGANGWLGQGLLKALQQGAFGVKLQAQHIRALIPAGQEIRALQKQGIEIISGDIRDAGALKDFMRDAAGAILLHTAGIIHPPPEMAGLLGRTAIFDAVNHRGTIGLIQAAERAGVKRAVIISSNSPLGANAQAQDVFDEQSPLNPYMGYGKSKAAMETALQSRIKAGLAPKIVILRAPWFYGPHQPPRQTLFFNMIKAGKFPQVGDGSHRRSMGYIDNLTQGMLRAAISPVAAGEIFWLADARPYPMREIIETVRQVLKDDFGFSVAAAYPQWPSFIADAARAADTLLQAAGLYQQKVHVLSEMNLTIACSIEKAKKMLGYAPQIELRQGMRQSIEWCLQNGQKIE